MAEFYFDNLAKNLPDVYKKDTSSNNFKILEIERTANVDLRSFLDEITAILNVDNASGATLDMYGQKYGQARGKATDAQYRIMIKSKISRTWCNGSYKSIVDAIAKTFNCSVDDILLSEKGVMAVSVDSLPMSAIIQAGFGTAQAERIIKNLLPVGVALESVLFEGTFEFGETENEYDESAGFSEAENGTVGGYLGWTGSQETLDELPI